jgi:hypothetical protein
MYPEQHENTEYDGDTPEFDVQTDESGLEAEQTNDGDIPSTGEDVDLDVDSALSEDDETETIGDGTAAAPTDEKAAKAKASRPAVPEGYIAPVEFAKVLTKHLQTEHPELGVRLPSPSGKTEMRPQEVYSYIKNNAAGSKHPFPAVSGDDINPETNQPYAPGRSLILKAAEGLEWWDTKDLRVKQGKAEKAEKAKAKAEKTKDSATNSADNEPTAPVQEAE